MTTVGASPPGTEIACSLRATERRGAEKIWTPWRLELSSGTQNNEEILRWLSDSCSFGCCQSVSPWAGILHSVILFSPRSLLPGQMHTNAFRSSTDKEWTRFRGSDVSGLLVNLGDRSGSQSKFSYKIATAGLIMSWFFEILPNSITATQTWQYFHSINKCDSFDHSLYYKMYYKGFPHNNPQQYKRTQSASSVPK